MTISSRIAATVQVDVGGLAKKRLDAIHVQAGDTARTLFEIALEDGGIIKAGTEGKVQYSSPGSPSVGVRLRVHRKSIPEEGDARKSTSRSLMELVDVPAGKVEILLGANDPRVPTPRVAARAKWVMGDNRLWYHGDSRKTLDFADQRYQNEAKWNAHGPGIYFTSSREQANGYAWPNGWVYTATIKGKLATDDQKPTRLEIRKFIGSMTPDERETLFSNWDENPGRALLKILDAYTQMDFVSAMADLARIGGMDFGTTGVEYVTALRKLGYVGALHKLPSVDHLVVWDPSALDVKSVEPYVSAEASDDDAAKTDDAVETDDVVETDDASTLRQASTKELKMLAGAVNRMIGGHRKKAVTADKWSQFIANRTTRELASLLQSIQVELVRRREILTQGSEEQKERRNTTLGDVATVGSRVANPHFWIQRNGSAASVGRPMKESRPDWFGVLVDTTKADPKQVFAELYRLWQSGYFKKFAQGALNLVHIRLRYVLSAPISVSSSPSRQARVGFKMRDRIPGGLADSKSRKDFDPKSLDKGKNVEKEHVGDDEELAEEIASDHLVEDPEYYDKLEQMEKKGHSVRVARRNHSVRVARMNKVANRAFRKFVEQMDADPQIGDELKALDPDGKKGYLNWAIKSARDLVLMDKQIPFADGEEVSSGKERGYYVRFPQGEDLKALVRGPDGSRLFLEDPVRVTLTDDLKAAAVSEFGHAARTLKQYDEYRTKEDFEELTPLAEIQSVFDLDAAVSAARKAWNAKPRHERAKYEVLLDTSDEDSGRQQKVTRFDTKDAACLQAGGSTSWCFAKWHQSFWESYKRQDQDLYEVDIDDDRYAVAVDTDGAIVEVKTAENEDVDSSTVETIAGVLEAAGVNITSTNAEWGGIEDAGAWMQFQFDADEAQEWINHGVEDPYAARDWRDAGYLPQTAALLADAGLTPQEADKASEMLGGVRPLLRLIRNVNNNFSAETLEVLLKFSDGREWLERMFSAIDGDEEAINALREVKVDKFGRAFETSAGADALLAWADAGNFDISVEDVLRAVITAQERLQGRAHSPERAHRPDEATELVSGLIRSNDLDSLFDWISAVQVHGLDARWTRHADLLTPTQALARTRAKIDPTSEYVKNFKWVKSPEEAAKWESAGIPAATVQKWVVHNFSPEEAKKWIAAGWHDPYEASRQRRHKFTLEQPKWWGGRDVDEYASRQGIEASAGPDSYKALQQQLEILQKEFPQERVVEYGRAVRYLGFDAALELARAWGFLDAKIATDRVPLRDIRPNADEIARRAIAISQTHEGFPKDFTSFLHQAILEVTGQTGTPVAGTGNEMNDENEPSPRQAARLLVGPRSKESVQRAGSFYDEYNLWIEPSGQRHQVRTTTHDRWALQMHGTTANGLLRKGWVRVAPPDAVQVADLATSRSLVEDIVLWLFSRFPTRDRVWVETEEDNIAVDRLPTGRIDLSPLRRTAAPADGPRFAAAFLAQEVERAQRESQAESDWVPGQYATHGRARNTTSRKDRRKAMTEVVRVARYV